eukprot:3415127-Rhodomonas_salina.2
MTAYSYCFIKHETVSNSSHSTLTFCDVEIGASCMLVPLSVTTFSGDGTGGACLTGTDFKADSPA